TSRAPPRSSACTARTCSRRCASSGSAPRTRAGNRSKETIMQFFARLCNLVRGALSGWIGRREHRHPEAVYEAAIQERIGRHAKLRAAAAGILSLRSKRGKELERESDEVVRARRQLDIAVERDDDPAALALISRRDALAAEVNRLTAELTEL